MDKEKALEILSEWMDENHVQKGVLANKTGYSPSLVTLIFKRKRKPTIEFLGDAAEALGHSKEELFKLTGYMDLVTPDEKADKEIIDLLNRMSLEQKQKEIRRIELNMELANEGKSKRTRTRTNQSNA